MSEQHGMDRKLKPFMELSLNQTLTKDCIPRGTCYRDDFASCGDPFRLDYGAIFVNAAAVSLGEHVYIGRYVFVDDIPVTIENHNLIGPYVTIGPLAGNQSRNPVVIKEGSWVAAHAFIAPGVTIGKGSTVAAGSVVLDDVPDRVLVGGCPARILKHYE